jgi:hypothetical protein
MSCHTSDRLALALLNVLVVLAVGQPRSPSDSDYVGSNGDTTKVIADADRHWSQP